MAKKKVQLTPAQAMGQAVKELRESRGMSRSELADALKVYHSAVWEMEVQGKRLTCENQVNIAGVLEVSWRNLARRAEEILLDL
jgi:transcriptional regulator with XRE-family HTH domain